MPTVPPVAGWAAGAAEPAETNRMASAARPNSRSTACPIGRRNMGDTTPSVGSGQGTKSRRIGRLKSDENRAALRYQPRQRGGRVRAHPRVEQAGQVGRGIDVTRQAQVFDQPGASTRRVARLQVTPNAWRAEAR